MLSGNNATVKKHEKTSFLLLIREESYVKDPGNINMETSFIYNGHPGPFFFVVCLYQ